MTYKRIQLNVEAFHCLCPACTQEGNNIIRGLLPSDETCFAVMRWRFTTDLYRRALVLLVNAVIALHETVLEVEFEIQVLHSERH